jgi:hypothetical protein
MVGRFERMERIDQFAFYRQIKSHFIETTALFELSTCHFEAMKRFLEDIEMEVREDYGDQLLRMFGDGRVAFVRRGDVSFHLRESTASAGVAPFNLFLTGYNEREAERLRSIGYDFRELSSPYGSGFQFTTPDGGTVFIEP